jgi:hypothetical protein
MQAVRDESYCLRPQELVQRGSAGKSCFSYAPASFTVTHGFGIMTCAAYKGRAPHYMYVGDAWWFKLKPHLIPLMISYGVRATCISTETTRNEPHGIFSSATLS